MKKILIICPDIPYPLTKGGRQGVFHFIDKLRNEYDFSFLFPLPEEEMEAYQELQQIWENVTFYPLIRQKEVAAKQSILSRLYHSLNKLRKTSAQQNHPDNSDFVRTHSTLYDSRTIEDSYSLVDHVSRISCLGFDMIQVEFYPFISLVHALPNNVEKIFIHHELRYVRNEIEMSLFEKQSNLDRYTFSVAKQFEIDTLKEYDKIVTVTDTDKEKLETYLPNKCIFGSPSMVDLPQNKEISEFSFNDTLSFVASSGHFPNYDGIRWFIYNVWPSILEKQPQLKLRIVGKGWDKAMFSEAKTLKNIYFDGYIKDLKDVLPNSIAIIPIRIGSGMRMKIIDAINFKIPFVTTIVGVEGLNFKDNKDCFIVDDALKFADAIYNLSSNTALQKQFIESSDEALKELYNESTLLNRRRLVYNTRI